MKDWHMEAIFYSVALLFLFFISYKTMEQMDGRNDCRMSKIYQLDKNVQEIFCKGLKE